MGDRLGTAGVVGFFFFDITFNRSATHRIAGIGTENKMSPAAVLHTSAPLPLPNHTHNHTHNHSPTPPTTAASATGNPSNYYAGHT